MWAGLILVWALTVVLRVWQRSCLSGFDFFILHGNRVYTRLWHRWSLRRRQTPNDSGVKGIRNSRVAFPEQGPCLLISNHTCSADPTFILACGTRYLSFLVSRDHFNLHPWTRRFLEYMDCVPVTRNGLDSMGLRQALRNLQRGRMLCIFPEGNLSGVGKDRILRGKAGMAFLALATRAPVYPIFIAGGPHTEHLLQSWVWPSKKAVRVILGPPVDLSLYYQLPHTRKVYEEVTELLMEKIRELREVG